MVSLGDDEDIAPQLIAMRAACRRFLATAEQLEREGWSLRPGQLRGTPEWIFNSTLGELRGVVGLHVAQLAAKYGLDVEDDLAAILPALADQDDEEPDGRPGGRRPER